MLTVNTALEFGIKKSVKLSYTECLIHLQIFTFVEYLPIFLLDEGKNSYSGR